LNSLALLGCATALRGDPAIPGAKDTHHSRNFGKPDERAPPPDFFGDFDSGIRSPKVLTVAMQKPYFAEEFLRRHAKQFTDAGVLQRRDAKIALGQDWRDSAGDSGAKFAIGVKEKPASGVAAFAIGVDIDQGDHGVTLRLSSCRYREA
jgi:hypothetical protein